MNKAIFLLQKPFCTHNSFGFSGSSEYIQKVSRKTLIIHLAFLCFVMGEALSQELHVHSNAASIDNEANSISGWTNPGATVTSDSTDPFHGSYAIKIEATSTADNNRRIEYPFSAIIGETYDISVWVKAGAQSVDPAFAAWDGVSGFANPTHITSGTTWTEYTFTVTATATTGIIRLYTGSGSQGMAGDVLYIDSVSIMPQSTSNETVWTESGDVASYSGDVAIGTTTVPIGYRLAVEGKVRAREIRVDQDTWPDYVFEKEYKLLSLDELQRHIEEKGHLPNIPSAKEVQANGVELGAMDRLLLEKIEELALYIIQIKEENQQLKESIKKESEQIKILNLKIKSIGYETKDFDTWNTSIWVDIFTKQFIGYFYLDRRSESPTRI